MTTIDEYEAQATAALAGVFTPDGIETWMTTANASFGGRSARRAIADGDGDLVLHRAEHIAGGAR